MTVEKYLQEIEIFTRDGLGVTSDAAYGVEYSPRPTTKGPVVVDQSVVMAVGKKHFIPRGNGQYEVRNNPTQY